MENENIVSLFHKIGELKAIRRSGWVRCGIPEPESVADHTFRCAFMAMMLGDMLEVDTDRLIKMALLHDIAEIAAGDITPYDGVTREEKSRVEEIGLEDLLEGIQNSEQYIALWREYEEGKTTESRVARNIDKLEMALQAIEYQNSFPEKDLSEFIDGAEKHMEIPDILVIFEILRKEKNQSGY